MVHSSGAVLAAGAARPDSVSGGVAAPVAVSPGWNRRGRRAGAGERGHLSPGPSSAHHLMRSRLPFPAVPTGALQVAERLVSVTGTGIRPYINAMESMLYLASVGRFSVKRDRKASCRERG